LIQNLKCVFFLTTLGGSEAGPVQAADDWEIMMFSISTAMDVIEYIWEVFMSFKCPEDITGAAKSVCAGILNTITVILGIVIFVLQQVPASSKSLQV
jgi:hypothetical protein